MTFSPDELAGIAGLFGGLRREELLEASSEVWYRHTGEELDLEATEEAIEAGIRGFQLVVGEVADSDVILPGPSAFAVVPQGAEDLPHILDISSRSIEREPLAEALRALALRELETDLGSDREAELRELSYDLETWATIDATEIRERLDAGK